MDIANTSFNNISIIFKFLWHKGTFVLLNKYLFNLVCNKFLFVSSYFKQMWNMSLHLKIVVFIYVI
jgi:hypothetical protein